MPPGAIAEYSLMVDAAMGLDKDSPESLQHADANLSPEAEMGSFLAARCSAALADTAAGVLGQADPDFHVPKVDPDYPSAKVDPDYHISKPDPDYPSSKADLDYQLSKADRDYSVSKVEPDCRISRMSEPDFSRISQVPQPDCQIAKVSESDCRVPNLSEGEDRAVGEEMADRSPSSGHDQRVAEREGEEEEEEREGGDEEEEALGALMGSRRGRESRSPEVDCPPVSSTRVFSPPMHAAQPLFV